MTSNFKGHLESITDLNKVQGQHKKKDFLHGSTQYLDKWLVPDLKNDFYLNLTNFNTDRLQ